MDTLKKIFPVSFMPKFTKDVSGLIIGILIYFGIGVAYPLVCGILAIVGIGFLLGLLGPIVGLYNMAGIVILILVFAKVIKDETAEVVETTAEETVETKSEEN